MLFEFFVILHGTLADITKSYLVLFACHGEGPAVNQGVDVITEMNLATPVFYLCTGKLQPV